MLPEAVTLPASSSSSPLHIGEPRSSRKFISGLTSPKPRPKRFTCPANCYVCTRLRPLGVQRDSHHQLSQQYSEPPLGATHLLHQRKLFVGGFQPGALFFNSSPK